ncbi:MAG: alpha/beta hydrolase [Deltaproteobacteria bacterium]
MKTKIMNKKSVVVTIGLMLTASLSGCFSNDNGSSADEPGSIYEPGLYEVLKNEDIVYARGLAHTKTSSNPSAVPLRLDVYFPDGNSTDRPVLMFIHGGGFTGGIKHKPEIVEMAEYYASRGWVYVSIDYRTTEELGDIDDMSQEEIIDYYQGIAPKEWIEHTFEGAESTKQIQQSVAMYAAQRDAKAALRWIVANAGTYNISTNEIAVGGASAGSITTIALGISNESDFRDEISIDEDPTLATTNLNETYDVKSMVYFWGSNVKVELYNTVYEVDRYDAKDPELFMAHGNGNDPVTPYEGALALQDIYDSLGIYNELVTLEGHGHGAWNAVVDGKGIFELSFDFLIDRQKLDI